MDFDDLIAMRVAPANRVGTHDGTHEQHLDEGAVMVAYAMHLLRTERTDEVRIHPDGMHGKQFDFAGWLERHGFAKTAGMGSTTWGGVYTDVEGRRIVVNPKSGVGDVVAEVGTRTILAECKGGVINSRHPGQKSRLDQGLCEVVGRLMGKPAHGRQVAVVPHTPATLRKAGEMAGRCAAAGIDIALVGARGEVTDIRPEH